MIPDWYNQVVYSSDVLIPNKRSQECRTAKNPENGTTHQFCRTTDGKAPHLTQVEVTPYGSGSALAIGLFDRHDWGQFGGKTNYHEISVKAESPAMEAEVYNSMSRLACNLGVKVLRDTQRKPIRDSFWWDNAMRQGWAKQVGFATAQLEQPCKPGRRGAQHWQPDFEMRPDTRAKAAKCSTTVNSSFRHLGPLRVRVCKEKGDRYGRREYDVRVKNEDGQIVGQAYFAESRNDIYLMGIKADDFLIDQHLNMMLVGLACRRHKVLVGPDLPLAKRGSYAKSEFWVNAHAAQSMRSGYHHYDPLSIDAHEACQIHQQAKNMRTADRAVQMPQPKKGMHRTQPGARSEYLDMGYEMAPYDLRHARCRNARVNRNQLLEVCTKKATPTDNAMVDARVTSKTGEILGKALFTQSGDTFWTIGVKGSPEAQLDLNLLGSRLACSRKKRFSSDFSPDETYFWRAQRLAGRARPDPDGDGSLFISAKDACQGTPQYSPRGVVENLRRRPNLLQGLRSLR